MVTAHGDVPTARAAFKEGAYDFIEKPLDLEVFRSLVNRAAEISTEPNPGMVAEYLCVRVAHRTDTLFRDIFRVPAASAGRAMAIRSESIWKSGTMSADT